MKKSFIPNITAAWKKLDETFRRWCWSVHRRYRCC